MQFHSWFDRNLLLQQDLSAQHDFQFQLSQSTKALFEIQKEPFEITVRQLTAALDAARLQSEQASAGIDVASVPQDRLRKMTGTVSIDATPENAASGEYPLSRFLYVYINKKPDEPISPIEREFLTLVLSKEGQDIVKKDGYVPVSPAVAARELAKLD